MDLTSSTHKFEDPLYTVKGDERAFVDLLELRTLWFNTGSLCNLACKNCYIESSPKNDRLLFLTVEDVIPFIDEIKNLMLPVGLIGFTGGEPFANPQIIKILEFVLKQGLEVLILTNGYRAISKYKSSLLELGSKYGQSLKIRVSLDHYSQEVHEAERGACTFKETLDCIKWLVSHQLSTSIAGRSLVKETTLQALAGYQELMDKEAISLKLTLSENIVIFPEMDKHKEVPEISTGCWNILNKKPADQMCAHERMIIKDKESGSVFVMPCTLLAYDKQFRMGNTLKDSKKRVQLNHPFCAEFCVLGGASCSSTR